MDEVKITKLEKYDEKSAAEMGRLLTFVSRRYDGRPLSKEWIEKIIESPNHDQLLAYDGDKLVGMATMSLLFVPSKGLNSYLHDMVVDGSCQGKGVGSKLWVAVVEWGREKGAGRLEFTAAGNSDKKAKALEFWLRKGAKVRDTNFFRLEL